MPNLTATGDVVRVRLYGLSATANTNLTLQGSPQSLLLSGNVLITRFGVGPDVDFAAFSSVGGVSAPPEPDAASNKIRLDVHVTSSPQLDFQNTYAKLVGTVDLTVRGTVAEPIDPGADPDHGRQRDVCRHQVRVAARGHLFQQPGAHRSDDRHRCDGAGGDL